MRERLCPQTVQGLGRAHPKGRQPACKVAADAAPSHGHALWSASADALGSLNGGPHLELFLDASSLGHFEQSLVLGGVTFSLAVALNGQPQRLLLLRGK